MNKDVAQMVKTLENIEKKKLPMPNTQEKSYYIQYDLSKHLEDRIIKYDSADIRIMRERMSKILVGDASELIPHIIGSIITEANESRIVINDVSISNYMM